MATTEPRTRAPPIYEGTRIPTPIPTVLRRTARCSRPATS